MKYLLDTNPCIRYLTHNVDEFRRIPGLAIEDWEQA